MSKHLVDLDEAALTAAKAELGTETIKDTVNAALRRAGRGRESRVKRALEVLAKAKFADRAEASRWSISSTPASSRGCTAVRWWRSSSHWLQPVNGVGRRSAT
jgi:Arc/MetJ family transcription regulator